MIPAYMLKKGASMATAIVPTYNEASRIARVLDILTTYPGFQEVIVVDDGSTDTTERVVRRYPVRFLKNPVNKGKGSAMSKGVRCAKTSLLFFADADVRGLTHEIIDTLVKPVMAGEVDMTIAMRGRLIYKIPGILSLVPHLGGERVLKKGLWNSLPIYYKHRFRVEMGLNFYAKRFGKGFRSFVFDELTQVIKEKKHGLIRGTRLRWQMNLNVLGAGIHLWLTHALTPSSARKLGKPKARASQ